MWSVRGSSLTEAIPTPIPLEHSAKRQHTQRSPRSRPQVFRAWVGGLVRRMNKVVTSFGPLVSHELRGRLTSFGRAHHELRMEVLASVCDAPSTPDGSQEPADEALDVMRDDSRPAASPASPLAAAIAPDHTVPAAGGPAVGMSVERAAFSPLANGHAVPRSASKRALPPSSGADGASETKPSALASRPSKMR